MLRKKIVLVISLFDEQSSPESWWRPDRDGVENHEEARNSGQESRPEILLKCLISVKLFLTSITLIKILLINIPAPTFCVWIHFQHHGHMTRTPKQNNILLLDPLYGHMTKTPEQNNIHVQINNDVWTNVSIVKNLI